MSAGWLKLALALASFAFVVYIIFLFYQWSGPLKDYFFKASHWEDLLVITTLVFAVGWVLKKLLKWELHAFFPKGRR
ncbi:MAG: hypothetical protein HY917_00435 [Candidatus Diapherotrites archaeon]|nr:hypothetical protein [Candidatus Diapherotrites archaeon]